jgi:RimJ/RimL family protein N-acetyltransferase
MADVFPLIATARLMMRPFATNDVDALHRLWIDPGVRKFLWDDQIIPRETAVAVVESNIDSFATHDFGLWAIFFKNDPKLIGFGGLRHFTEDGSENEEVEILYGVAPEHWGKGIAPEAAREVLRYGFEGLKLANIYAGADPPNVASFRVIEKLGMKFARKTMVNGLEAIYYLMNRDDYKIHFELDSKIGLK